MVDCFWNSVQSSTYLFIPNGAFDGDGRGHYTFVSAAGNSIPDYFALLRSVSHLPQKMCVEGKIDLQHIPIPCVLSCIDHVRLDSEFKPFDFKRLIWLPENLSMFKLEHSLGQNFHCVVNKSPERRSCEV